MSLNLSNVSKSFGERVLFSDVSLHLGGRARVALVGPNGAGKTTLIEIIAGEQDADTGTVTTWPLADTCISIWANMPGLSNKPGLASSTRTGTVRVSAFSVG